ncbi:MAG: SLC13 family permease [Betaproteobacteria bacterium]|nr:SLC13 family permease [Betaproteobacteria bacterium]
MALTVVALFLFTREKIPLETSAMAVIAVLAIGFELFPYHADGKALHAIEFFHGFGHEALVAVCALMIVGQGLVRTGALEPLGRILAVFWRAGPLLAMLVTLSVAAVLSAFVNNTPIVVLLLPVLISVSLRTGTSPSRVLMPMGFSTLIGGAATTIGTSTNLLVVSVAADLGLRSMGLFDFVVPAAMAGAVGIVFLCFLAPRLLPERSTPLMDASPRVFTAHLRIREGSFADGKTLSEVLARAGDEMRVIRVERGSGLALMKLPDMVLEADDRLLLTDTPKNLKHFETALGGTLYSGEVEVDEEHPLTAADQQISEIVVVQDSPIEGRTLKELQFIDRYQLVVLALHRAGRELVSLGSGMGDVALRAGDVLLVQGPAEQIAALRLDDQILVLDATTDLPHVKKSPTAILIMTVVILVAAFGFLPIAVSAMAGVLMMILTRCLSWEEAGKALNIQVILIVVASLGLGLALMKTGGADYLAKAFVATSFGAPPLVVLGGLTLLMGILTNVVSSNAAAVIGTPIAVSIAQQIGQPPEAFLLAVIFGANLCYATPLAHKINVLVMAAGGYTFGDFVRVGLPLAVVMWIAYTASLGFVYGI